MLARQPDDPGLDDFDYEDLVVKDWRVWASIGGTILAFLVLGALGALVLAFAVA